MKYLLLLFMTTLFLSSCAHVRSGHYVEAQKGDTLESLAKDYHVSSESLKQFNEQQALKAGDWVFVPLARGVLTKILEVLARNDKTPRTKTPQVKKSRKKKSKKSPQVAHDSKDHGRFLWPVPGVERISSYFGPRGKRNHQGIDVPARVGTHIVATEKGEVIYSGNGMRGYGNVTIIKHAKKIFSLYAHAHKNYTKRGQKVHRGQVIATVGSTGRSSGPHLHFEIRKGEKKVDPLLFVPHPGKKVKLAQR